MTNKLDGDAERIDGFGRRRRHRAHGPSDPVAGDGCTLADLAIGDEAEIVGYTATHRGYRSKLLSMGLTRGTRIVVRNRAPLGDPVQVGVRDFELSLRTDEAAALRLIRVPRADRSVS